MDTSGSDEIFLDNFNSLLDPYDDNGEPNHQKKNLFTLLYNLDVPGSNITITSYFGKQTNTYK